MKNQYVGDINDYKKYTLIEIISNALNKKVLIAWMLTGGDGTTQGNKLSYLENKKNERQFNPDLFNKLNSIVMGKRGIDEVQRVLGDKYSFYSTFLKDNKADRTEYFDGLLNEIEKIGLVFFDPDNGIEVKSVKCGNKNSSKYLYWDEIKQFTDKEKDLLIYQHFPRKERETFIEELTLKLYEKTKTKMKVLPIVTENVLFLLVTKEGHKIDEINSKWNERILVLKKNKI